MSCVVPNVNIMDMSDFIFFRFTLFICSLVFSAGNERNIIGEYSVIELQQSILEANNIPVCILYKKDGTYPVLQQKYTEYLDQRNLSLEYSNWLNGIFPVDKHAFLTDGFLPIGGIPKVIPLVRCYIGYHIYDKTNITTPKALNKWFTELSIEKENQIPEANEDLIFNKSVTSDLLVVGFASLKQHHEIEKLLQDIKVEWFDKNVDILFVHHNSEHPHDAESLSKLYGVRKKPAVVFIENNLKTKNKPAVVKVIQLQDTFEKNDVHMFLTLRFMDAMHLNVHNYMAVCGIKSKFYVPMLILYYLPSSIVSYPYVSMFYRTVEYLQQLGLKMRFGTMELNNQALFVVTDHIKDIGKKEKLPVVVFLRNKWLKTTVVDIEQIFIRDRPTVSNVVEILSLHNALLNSQREEVIPVLPWGLADANEVTMLSEGPRGTICTRFSHNQTISEPEVIMRKRKVYTKPKPVPITTNITEVIIKPNITALIKPPERDIFRNWHDRFDMEEIDEKLSQSGNLHLLTSNLWQEVIEKSHVPKHPFYSDERWQGEVVKTSLVVFIQAECGSCERKIPLFEALNKAIKFVDGGALYLANCTSDPQLCIDNKVTGFPTLIAFRGLGWLETMEKCTRKKIQELAKPVEIEYHGVLLQKNILDWFVRISGPAVMDMRGQVLKNLTKDDPEPVRLVAKLVPRNSSYLLKLTHKVITKVYPYECLRLACERLYSQIGCVLQHHPRVPKKHFEDGEQELVVTQVSLERVDGFNATVMHLGRPLIDTMDAEAKANKAKFHKPHKYKFPQGRIKCEDQPAFCTDLMMDFSKDHGRLPVTQMSLKTFHTRDSLLFHDNLPVLMALVHKENVTENSTFYEMLQDVAMELYDRAIVVTVDVDKFSSWAHTFVPKGYMRIDKITPNELPPLYIFPRFCALYWNDHHRAAFYPFPNEPVSVLRPFDFKKKEVLRFMHEFFKNPKNWLIETEHF